MDRKKFMTDIEFSILNIDKPSNYTSFQTAEIVGKIVGARKFSHFGTLDPKVTGVLPVALNRACKLTGWFMKKDKTYAGVMKLHKQISEEKLKEEMEKFIGKIKQLPPVKSRVKRELREREVYSWDILEKQGNLVLFETKVEAGTYIRKLIHDLGLRIGGAHMTELRRTQAGIFEEEDKEFVNLYQLEDAINEYKNGNDTNLKKIIIPADEAIKKILPAVQAKPEAVKNLLTGKPIFINDLVEKKIPKGEEFAVFCGKKFVGVYRKANEKVSEGEIVLRAEFVLN